MPTKLNTASCCAEVIILFRPSLVPVGLGYLLSGLPLNDRTNCQVYVSTIE